MASFIRAVSVAFFIFICVSNAIAVESDWVDIAKHPNGMLLQIRKGYFIYDKNKKGDPVVTAPVRTIERGKPSDVTHWRVSLADCSANKGKIETVDTNGNNLHEAAFSADGSDTPSLIAGVMCGAVEANSAIKQKNKHKNLGAIDAKHFKESEWVEFATLSNGVEAKINPGSFSHRTTKGGEPVIAILVRSTPDKIHAAQIEQWYVKTKDCTSGKGKMVTVDSKGNFLYEDNFDTSTAFSKTNIFSVLASVLCARAKTE